MGNRWCDASVRFPGRALVRTPVRTPVRARRWLQLETSMTRALQQRFPVNVQLRVLKDAAGRLLPDEARLLGTHKSVVHVREVVLGGVHTPLLAARTVYTRTHTDRQTGRQKQLASLGNRPLGDLLFAVGKPRYLHRQFARLTARMPLSSLVRRATGKACTTCWARRTVFLLGHQRLLVTEIFLPAMFRRCTQLNELNELNEHNHTSEG